jgi:hypothetical protein
MQFRVCLMFIDVIAAWSRRVTNSRAVISATIATLDLGILTVTNDMTIYVRSVYLSVNVFVSTSVRLNTRIMPPSPVTRIMPPSH